MRGKEKAFPAGPQHTWAGLTKREWIATQLLAAEISKGGDHDREALGYIAKDCVMLADTLIKLCDGLQEE